MQIDLSRYRVKLAETEAERVAAQRLRYRVFVEERGAHASPAERAAGREWDAFDPYFDHLLLVDLRADGDPVNGVVGVYRLMPAEAAARGPGFYCAREYDLGPIERSGRHAVELGRSCVDAAHRGGPAMHLLWSGLADYVLERGIEIMFGAASFSGTDPDAIAEALAFLYHRHLAPSELRVRARPDARVEMDRADPGDIDAARALEAIPPLIKAYLRLGGFVGDGAYIDRDFNTIDVCVVMDTGRMAEKHRAFYARSRGVLA